jgi:hypothetical protein
MQKSAKTDRLMVSIVGQQGKFGQQFLQGKEPGCPSQP